MGRGERLRKKVTRKGQLVQQGQELWTGGWKAFEDEKQRQVGDRIKANRQRKLEMKGYWSSILYTRHFSTWLIPLYGRLMKRVHPKRREAYTELRDVTKQKTIIVVVATMGT